MKRHDSLIPLTHDHHHALAQARRLRLAAAREEDERLPAVEEFLAFFENDTLLHFREEEEVIFPLVVEEVEAAEPLQRLLMDHVWIHAAVAELRFAVPDVSAKAMEALATRLESHIRFEEKTFFPLVERLASSRLGGIALSERVRGPS